MGGKQWDLGNPPSDVTIVWGYSMARLIGSRSSIIRALNCIPVSSRQADTGSETQTPHYTLPFLAVPYVVSFYLGTFPVSYFPNVFSFFPVLLRIVLVTASGRLYFYFCFYFFVVTFVGSGTASRFSLFLSFFLFSPFFLILDCLTTCGGGGPSY